jgi:hypothetical protein
MKPVKNIIREEILKFEGVADKAAERMFNIPDPSAAMQHKASSAMNNTGSGEFIGSIIEENKNLSRIFVNPQSLASFQASVKALTSKTGDLFVCETNEMFYHSDIEQVVEQYYEDDTINRNSINEYFDDDEMPNYGRKEYMRDIAGMFDSFSTFVGWYRKYNTNEFFLANSNQYKDNISTGNEYIDMLSKKHPNFKFTYV